MQTTRIHPLASVSAVTFLAAQFLPYMVVGVKPSLKFQLALLVLSSPFAVLLAGHIHAGARLGRNLLVAVFNILLGAGWVLAMLVMFYFKPGLPGALAMGGMLATVAAVLLLFTRFVREAPPAEHGAEPPETTPA